MTLRQTIQAAPGKTSDLITKLAATSNEAVKTRESLFAQLSDELSRYVEFEEQHFLPLLRKHPDTKSLAADALKGNKDQRASLAKLSRMPKDNDAFLAELDVLNKSFQQHVRNERKELLPAVLTAFSDEEAGAFAAGIEDAVAGSEKAKRDERREEAAQVRLQAEEADQLAAAERAAARAQKAAERNTSEAAQIAVDMMQRGAASMQDGASLVTAAFPERTQQVASESRGAMTVSNDSSRKFFDDVQAVMASSAVSVGAASEVWSTWSEWFGNAARMNSDVSQRLMQCRSVKQVAELQEEFATSTFRNWMERNAKFLQIAQRTSKQAGSSYGRLNDVA